MNTDTEKPTGDGDGNAELNPGFLRAFAGIWVFTRLNRWFVIAFAAFVPLLTLAAVEQGSQSQFLNLAVKFHQLFVLPLFCLGVFGPLIRDDVQADTLGFLLTRPVTRARLLLLKFLCLTLLVQGVVLVAGVIILLCGLAKGVTVPGLVLPFFASQAIAVLAYGALATLFGLLSRKYMVLGLVYGGIVEVGIGGIPTNIQVLAVSHHLETVLARCAVIQDAFNWTAGTYGSALLHTVGGAAGVILVSMLLFSVREYHHTDEMQK